MTHATLTRIALCLFLLIVPAAAMAQTAANSAAAGYASVALEPAYGEENYSESVVQVLESNYKLKLKGASQNPAFEWIAVDPLPLGLTIDPATGQIFGKPLRPRLQPYLFRVHIVDRSVANPAPLKLQLSLRVIRGPRPGAAPTLVPVGAGDTSSQRAEDGAVEAAGNGGSGDRAVRNDDGVRKSDAHSSADVEIANVEEGPRTTVSLTIKNPSISQVEVLAKNKDGRLIDSAKTPADLPRGEIQTSVVVKLEEGSNTLEVRNAETEESYAVIPVVLGQSGKQAGKQAGKATPQQGKAVKVVHSGYVTKDEEVTTITIVAEDPKVKSVEISVKSQVGQQAAKKLSGYPEEIKLKRGVNEYPVVIPVATEDNSVTKVTVTGVISDDPKKPVKQTPVDLTIEHGAPAALPRIQVNVSRKVSKEINSVPVEVAVNDPKITRIKVIVAPVVKTEEDGKKTEKPGTPFYWNAWIQLRSATGRRL